MAGVTTIAPGSCGPGFILSGADDVELLIAGGGLTGLLLGVHVRVPVAVAVVDRQELAATLGEQFDGAARLSLRLRKVLDGLGLWASSR